MRILCLELVVASVISGCAYHCAYATRFVSSDFRRGLGYHLMAVSILLDAIEHSLIVKYVKVV